MFESYLDKKLNAARGLLPKKKPQQAVEEFKEESLRENVDYLNSRGILEQGTVDYIQKDILKDRAPTSFAYGGRIGFDRGGMANVLKYLESLEPGTNITMNDLKKIAKKNKWEFAPATLYRMLNDPDRKQIAKSGNEVFMYGEENRNRAKNIIERINFDQKIQIKPNEEVFKRIDLMIEDKEKFPSMKSIGEELGYKATKKGQGGNLGLESPLMKEYQKSRGRNLINEMRFKEYKLTEDSPWVKKVLDTRKKLKSTRAAAKALEVDRKTIRNITEQFAPHMFGGVNLRKSDKWNYKRTRAKREAELAKRLGGKNNPAFLQYMDLWEDIVDANEDILRMSDDAIYKNPRIKMAMNVDVTGLKIDKPLNFDKYRNLSKKEFAQKVRDMAKTNQFFQAEHSIPISSEKIAAGYPNNLQVAQGKIGSQLETIKTYIKNNPNGKHIPQINEFLNEFDIQIREGGQTYGWTNPKNKSGLNVYNTESRTSDIVESALNKNASNTISNKNLKDQTYTKTEMFEQAMNKRGTKVKAQTVSKLAKDMNVNICSTQIVKKSGGGRIGFKGKICGEEFAKKQPERFLAQVENSPLQEKLVKLKNNNPARFKALMKNTGKAAKVIGRSTFGPLGVVGGEAIAYGLTDWAGGKMGLSSETSSDVAAWWNNKDSAREDIYKAMEKLGYTDGEQAAVNKFLDATNSQALYERSKVAGASDLAQNYEPISGISQEKIQEIVEFRIAQAKQKYDDDVESMFKNMFIGTGINPNEATAKEFGKQIDIISAQAMGGLGQATRTSMQKVDPKRYEAMTTQVNPYAGPFWNFFTGSKAIRGIFGNERAQNLLEARQLKLQGKHDEANEIIRIENEKINFPMSQATWHDQTFKVPMQAMQGWLDNTVGGFGKDTSTAYGKYMPQMMAGGGIASIRRPNAIPPEKGPLPQGLENLRYYVT